MQTYPLTVPQKAIYDSLIYTSNNMVDVITVSLLYAGKAAVENVKEAIKTLFKKQQVLRLSLYTVDGQPFFRLNDSIPDPEVQVFRSRKEYDVFVDSVTKKKDFKNALCNIRGIVISDTQYGLLVSISHLIADAWSIKVLEEQFPKAYAAACVGIAPDFAVQSLSTSLENEKRYLHSNAYIKDKNYWEQTVRSNMEPIYLAETNTEDFSSNRLEISLDKSNSEALMKYCAKHQLSLLSLVSAALGIYLCKNKQVNQLYLGLVCHNRNRSNGDAVGMFVNTVPALLQLNPSGSFSENVAAIRNSMLVAIRHQRYHYSRILNDLRKAYSFNEKLYDVTLSFQDLDIKKIDTDVRWFNSGFQTESLMIHISNYSQDQHLAIDYDYQTAKFTAEDIQRLHTRLMHILNTGIQNDEITLSQMSVIDAQEFDLVVNRFNQNDAVYPKDENLVTLFRRYASENKEKLALVSSKNRGITYEELDRITDDYASVLRSHGVKVGDRVALIIERGYKQIIGMLATLKAGAGYIPMLCSYPKSRKDDILKDGEPRVILLDDPAALKDYRNNFDCIDMNLPLLPTFDRERVCVDISPDNLAYVIFTSGTTGKPKGVMVTHENVVRLLKNDKFQYSFDNHDTWIQFHSYCFDFSVWEIFGALLNGAKLFVPTNYEVQDSYILNDIIEKHQITVLNQVPSSFYNLIIADNGHKMKSVRYLIFGGEKLAPEKLKNWAANYQDAIIVNMYGITETTVHVTFKQITEAEINSGISNIGAPIPTLRVYVMNGNSLCGIHMPGELCVTGSGVSCGYINRPNLTNQKFVENPYGDGKMYRSGDLVEWLPNGDLHYLGRIDHQIQLHGFRIELGEIECALRKFPGISDAVAICRFPNNETQIHAYYCAEHELQLNDIRSHLGAILPGYMMPSMLMQLQTLPLTPNGKLDTKALPVIVAATQHDYVAPQTEVEKILIDAVMQIIPNAGQIGMTDNFIELGGDSISAIRVVSLLHEKQMDLKVWEILNLKIMGLISEKIEPLNSNVLPVDSATEAHFSYIQNAFFRSKKSNPDFYLQSILLRLNTNPSHSTVADVLRNLCRKHPMLRAQFSENMQSVRQNDSDSWSLYEYDFTESTETALAEQIRKASYGIKQKISIRNGKMIGCGVFRGCNNATFILLAVHHLVIDGVSWRILLRDFQDLLHNPHIVFPLNINNQYLAWAEYSHQNRKIYQKELNYWNNICAFGKKKSDVHEKNHNPIYLQFVIDPETTENILIHSHKAYKTSINELLAAVAARTFSAQYDNAKIVAEFEGHGRIDQANHGDIFDTVGWFTSIYPVLLTKGASIEQDINLAKVALRYIPNDGIGYLAVKEYNDSVLNKYAAQVRINYLGNLFEAFSDGSIIFDERYLCRDTEERVQEQDVVIDCFCYNKQLYVRFSCAGQFGTDEAANNLTVAFRRQLCETVQFCMESQPAMYTSGDLGKIDLCTEELSELCSKCGENIQLLDEMTMMQKGMLYYSLNNISDGSYIIQAFFDFSSAINFSALQKSWERLSEDYQILRSGFLYIGDKLIRVALKNVPNVVQEITFDSEEAYRKWVKEDKLQGFALEKAPLFRITAAKFGNVSKLVWTVHHLIMDGWSLGICINRFFDLYSRFCSQNGEKVDIPVVEDFSFLKYVDFLRYTCSTESTDFWKKTLEGYEGRVALHPANRNYDTKDTFLSASYEISHKTTKQLQDFCRSCGITMNSLFETAVGILLHRYSRSEDVVFGKVVSGRNADLNGIETAVGMFVNTIPCRIRFNEKQTVSTLLNAVQELADRSRKYELYSLSDLQKNTDLQAYQIQTLLVFENYFIDDNTSDLFDRIGMRFEGSDEQTNYDMTISVFPRETLGIRFLASARHYRQQEVEFLFRHLTSVLEELIRTPQKLVAEIRTVDKWETDLVYNVFNNTKCAYPEKSDVVTLFQKQAAKTPDTVAVIFQDRILTYKELDALSDRIAAGICEKIGSNRKGIVPLILNRSENIHAAMLGILKSGNCYLPIDPTLPVQRIQQIVSDSGQCELAVSSANLFELQSNLNIPILCIDSSLPERFPADAVHIFPQDPCYVIYTSGSTGKPKGTVLTHRNVVNFCCNNTAIMASINSTISPIMVSTTTIVFDIFVTESLLQLLNGTTILMANEEQQIEQDALNRYVLANKATAIQTSPSKMKALIYDETKCDYLKDMTTIILGGEVFPPALYTELRKYTNADIFNIYGPSEATVWITTSKVISKEITIGKPFSNTFIYVLGKNNRICGVGETGELCVAGDCVGTGYLKRPELTAEKFVDNPFGTGKMYRTGDLATWNHDGSINYIGRIDNQVKINGQRIELGEIEAVIHQIEGIVNVAVIVDKDRQLCCYYEAQTDISSESFNNEISSILPVYMIPRYFLRMDRLPLNANGKIDRKNLPEIEKEMLSYEEPKTDIEKELAQAFCKALKLERIGLDDSFFLLGGDSIRTIELISLLCNYNLHIKDVSNNPTVRKLARIIERSSQNIPQEMLTGETGLLPAQKMCLRITDAASISAFHQTILLTTEQHSSQEEIRIVLKQLLRHHDALRLRYVYGSDKSDFVPAEQLEPPVFSLDCTPKDFEEQCNLVHSAIDLEKGIEIAGASLSCAGKYYVLLVVHHWCCDGLSQRILIHDFTALYRQQKNNESFALPAKTHSVRAWYKALEEKSADFSSIRPLFQAAVEKIPEYQPEPMGKWKNKRFALSKDVSQWLIGQTNVLDRLLAAFSWAFASKKEDKVTVFLESHGRDTDNIDCNITRTVGWFTSVYPLQIPVIKDTAESLRRIHTALEGIPHCGLPYTCHSEKFYHAPLFNYLGSIQSSDEEFAPVYRSTGSNFHPQMKSTNPMVINIVHENEAFHVDIHYSGKHYSASFIRHLITGFQQRLLAIMKEAQADSFATRMIQNAVNYGSKADEFVTVLGKNGKLDLFVFPPAMLKIAYLPIFEKMAAAMRDYRLHVFHLTADENMDEIFGNYIQKVHSFSSGLHFLGYSGGSNIAYDTAAYLNDIGIDVQKILMIDGFRWEDGMDFVTLTEDNIDRMIHDFLKQSNISESVFRSSSMKQLLQRERAVLIKEAITYQNYCEKHKNNTKPLHNCQIVNILSEDVIKKETDTRRSWDKCAGCSLKYVNGIGNHLSMVADDDNIHHNIALVLNELKGNNMKNNNNIQTSTIVELQNVTKDFGSGESVVHALKNVSVAFYRQQLTVILGPSGSGKTTLLNIASTLEKCSSGKVLYNSVDSTKLSGKKMTDFRKENVGFIFQAYHLLPNLNVTENVLVGAALTGSKKNVDEILHDVGLGEKKDKFPFQLSGGEQQRVSIARALAKKTDILFCDEPTGALDTETSKLILNLLLRVRKERSLAIIVVTHNPQIAEIADRVIRMRDGEIVSDIVNNSPKTVEEVDWLK